MKFKKFLFGKINRKFISIAIFQILMIVAVGAIFMKFQNQDFEREYLSVFDEVEHNFEDVKEGSTRTLSAALEVVLHDKKLKDVYLEKDREKLFNYGQSLFQNLKNKYQITHFYFIEPDGKCFVRLHNKKKYGDDITRFTFFKARDTKNIGTGIELGKTAFALRVISPYYDNGKLIGYVELGREIDSFLETMKKRKNSEFALVVEKKYLKKEKWVSVREASGLRNNWDDHENHVAITSTIDEKIDCFRTENVEKIINGEDVLEKVERGDVQFIGGGFPLFDAGDRKVGAVFALIDSSDKDVLMEKMRISLLSILLITIFSVIMFSFFLIRFISKPIQKLSLAAEEMEKGSFETKIKFHSLDEIGDLANSYRGLQKGFREKAEITDHIADGDLSKKLNAKSVKDRLALSINKIVENYRIVNTENEKQNWLKTGQNELNKKLQGELDVIQVAGNTITFLAKQIVAQVGTIYVYDENSKELTFSGSYAFVKRKGFKEKIKTGEGLVGQAAFEKKIITAKNLPVDYIRINSALGETNPRNVIVIPFIYEKRLVGVAELGSIKEFSDEVLDFLKSVSENIAIALSAAQSRKKMKELLKRTQKQSEEF